MSNNIKALEISGDQYRGKRFAIVDIDSGEVLDDAQGYGYKTAQKAHAAWVYKHRDTSKDRERAAKRQHIVGWLKKHKDFRELMDQIAFEIMKGSGVQTINLMQNLLENCSKMTVIAILISRRGNCCAYGEKCES